MTQEAVGSRPSMVLETRCFQSQGFARACDALPYVAVAHHLLVMSFFTL